MTNDVIGNKLVGFFAIVRIGRRSETDGVNVAFGRQAG
jgi:hypothetical protein